MKVITAILSCVAISVAAAESRHPCVYFHADELPSLREKAKDVAWAREIVARWHREVDSAVLRHADDPSFDGTGRVWSEMMTTQLFFPLASSRSRGEPIGLSSALRTISRPSPSAFNSPMRDSMTPAPYRASSNSIHPCRKGSVSCVIYSTIIRTMTPSSIFVTPPPEREHNLNRGTQQRPYERQAPSAARRVRNADTSS